MALSSHKYKTRPIQAGQNGCTYVEGMGQFSTTDASGSIDCVLSVIEGVVAFPIGPVATDESLYCDNLADVIASQLAIKKPASGLLTITRTGAAKTNNLIFSFRYWGY